ncbi:ABC-type Fe3+-siderophore transport system [Gracilibacillus boraciitolerans JCM 21714]|uniref:ABC-type Fe3+-siderophore transport system n=1 Tax=Gracilibacillus boraciitolerans JCM 21714 TaxID=1298598 RepID=W4VQG4_9BACI|nr:ABC-type Fe3+-siderophore transport system [Gracilibacillus boraciitolerans JCM 21714]
MINNNSVTFIMAGRRQRRRRWLLVTGLLTALACILCCFMLLLGNTIYPVNEVLRALSGEQINGVSFAINTIRLPRMLTGLIAGFAFGIAGNTFQTMLRNPLASPDVIGITAGSSAAAVFCILILHTSGAIVSIASVIAGLITVLLIYIFSRGLYLFNWTFNSNWDWYPGYAKRLNFLSSTCWRSARYSRCT